MKKIHKFAIVFVLLIVLFLSLSCGIPSYLTLAISDPTISSTVTERTIEITDIRINATQKLDLFNTSQVTDQSPSLSFFYTITNSNIQQSGLQTNFNTSYSSEYSRKPKSAIVTENGDSSIIEYKYSDIIYRLFVLKADNINWESPNGHINKITIPDNMQFNFNISKETDLNNNDNSFIKVTYEDNNKVDQSLELKRYDNSYFTKLIPDSINNDYNTVTNSDSKYVHIYAAVNVVGSSLATFTNRFWSDLMYLGSYDL